MSQRYTTGTLIRRALTESPALRKGLRLTLVLAMVGQAAPRVALGTLLGFAAVLLVVAAVRHRQLEPVRRRRRLAGERAYIDRVIARIEEAIGRVEIERAALMESRTSLQERRLLELQNERLRDRLKHHFIGELEGVEGVPHKAVIRLKTNGIRTAYQLTPERLAKVAGLDPAARARIATWRAALVRQYEPDVPTRLSPAPQQRLDRYLARRRDAFDAEQARLEARLEVQRDEKRRVEERLCETPDVSVADVLLELLGWKAIGE